MSQLGSGHVTKSGKSKHTWTFEDYKLWPVRLEDKAVIENTSVQVTLKNGSSQQHEVYLMCFPQLIPGEQKHSPKTA